MKKFLMVGIVLIGAAGLIIFLPENQSTPYKGYSSAEIEQISPNTVVMKDNGYEPSQITIKAGQKVTFINGGEDDHWPASDNHPTHEEYSQFDPKRPIKPGAEWSFTFDQSGSYKFHDHLYPSITGTIIVEP